MKAHGKTFVVTGGGSGIGRELVLQLARKGARIIIADVDAAGMEETKRLAQSHSAAIYPYTLDLSDSHAIDVFAARILTEHGAVDGLINNAGIIQPFVPLNDLATDKAEYIMRVNFYGTFHLIKLLLPHLLTRPEAHIVNISSMGAFIPFPGQTIYGASKAAVKLLTEGLYAELLQTSVRVTLVMPGAVDTKIMEHSGVSISKEALAGMEKAPRLPASKAAECIIEAMENNQPRLVLGSDARFLDIFSRFFPTRSIRYIVKKMLVK